ncbi:MAG: MerR family transcriptional regulator [Deltaproteobacteria bacterium]|nr:MerR family transcriptional regulator [Deltaproteobacteria bacterium]
MTHTAAELARAPEVEGGVVGSDGHRWTYRMKDLCDATGLQRQAIHFYIKEGLVPPGHKSSRNMAWYGELHLARLRHIKTLQHERFLPLRAIKAVLDEAHDDFTVEQRTWLRDMKHHVGDTLARHADRLERVAVEPLLARTGVSEAELAEMDRLGLVPVVAGALGQRFVAAQDVWAVETLSELRALGFTAEAGFPVQALAHYEEAISRLFERELEQTRASLVRFSPAEAARMIERVLPLIHRFLTRYHEAKIRRFFAALQ